jgi:hypothetical protein
LVSIVVLLLTSVVDISDKNIGKKLKFIILQNSNVFEEKNHYEISAKSELKEKLKSELNQNRIISILSHWIINFLNGTP